MSSTLVPQVPKYDELLWPTIKALNAMGGSASNEELLAKVIEIEKIPDSIASFMHIDNRRTRLDYNLAWAKTYLKRVGAIENSTRGVWSLTDHGEKLSEADMETIPATVRRQQYESRKQRDAQDKEDDTDKGDTSDDSEIEESWKDQLISVLRLLSPSAFERLAQRILREAGFVRVEVTGRSGDGGIDGLGVLRVNLLSFQVLFQCKRYQSAVGSPEVRNFRGAMIGRCDKGLIITTGTFTNDAKREATRDGAPAIDLIDGDQLCELLKSLKLGITVEVVEKVIINADWFDRV